MLNASAARRARVSGADLPELAELVDDPLVVRGIRGSGHAGRVAGCGAEQRRASDVDHLDRFVEADELGPDGRGERLHVDDDQVDQADSLFLELLELRGNVASGEDPGVDRVVERLDLAADRAAAPGSVQRPRPPRRLRRPGTRAFHPWRRPRPRGRAGRERRRRFRLGSPLTAGLAPGASSRSPRGALLGHPCPRRLRRRPSARAEYTA